MKKIIIKSCLILFFFITSNCGFKVLDNSDLNNFTIKEINSSGDRRSNFIIKNNLLQNSSRNSHNILSINLETNKIKNTIERNLKKEITKNEIILHSNIEIYLINKNKQYKINHSVSGDYLVKDSYAATLSVEGKVTKNLANNIANKILKDINLIFNDL